MTDLCWEITNGTICDAPAIPGSVFCEAHEPKPPTNPFPTREALVVAVEEYLLQEHLCKLVPADCGSPEECANCALNTMETFRDFLREDEPCAADASSSPGEVSDSVSQAPESADDGPGE